MNKLSVVSPLLSPLRCFVTWEVPVKFRFWGDIFGEITRTCVYLLRNVLLFDVEINNFWRE